MMPSHNYVAHNRAHQHSHARCFFCNPENSYTFVMCALMHMH